MLTNHYLKLSLECIKLLCRVLVPDLDRSRLRWEKDLGINLDVELRDDLCRDGVTSTLNSRYRLIQFSFLHQLYITPYKLHKYNSNIWPFCFKCGLDDGTLLRSTWQCPKFQGFWQGVCDTLSSIHGVVFPLDLEIGLLCNFTNFNLKNATLQGSQNFSGNY